VTAHTPAQDSFGVAVGYLMFGIAAGLALDLCAKWLLASYSLEQFVFLRSTFGLLTLLALIRWYGGLSSLHTRRWRWHLLRTGLACIAMFGFFYGLSKMPLVNALTLAFTAPLIVTALSVPLLGEHVGWRRWTAVMVGFGGVMLVLRPQSNFDMAASLALLASAAGYAGLAITARKLAATETTFSMSFYVIAGPLTISSFLLGGDFRSPEPFAWLLFVLAGICSAAAWVGIVGAYRRAPPVVLAPFEYTALIGAAIAGYYIWNEVPDRWVVVGSSIIMGSGLYIVSREMENGLTGRYLRAFTAGVTASLVRRSRKPAPDDDLTGL